jgi:penicillin-binding protein 1A
MKSIIGGFCGSFPQPKEPFVASPFFGEYASTGGGKLGFGDEEEESTEQESTEPVEPEPTEPEDTAPSGGTEFDPEQYESAPQDPPETEEP